MENESQFLKSKNIALRRLGTSQIRWVLRASLAVYTYAMRSIRILELFYVFIERETT